LAQKEVESLNIMALKKVKKVKLGENAVKEIKMYNKHKRDKIIEK
jgi:hypothetical protein